MKKLIIIILGLFSIAQAQTVGQFRYDTTKFYKVGGRNHVKIENLIQLSDSTAKPLAVGADGVIKQVTYWPGAGSGGGSSRYVTPQYGMLSDSTTTPGLYRLSVDTTSSTGIASKTRVQNGLNSKVSTIVAGSNITVDNTDPLNPVVSSSGGGYDSVSNITNGFVLIKPDATEDTVLFNISSIVSYGKNASGDSTILLLSNGSRYAAKDSVGTGGGSITLSAIGSTPNANGATITGSALNLEPASGSFGGVVTTGTQTFAGAKTFSNDLTASANINLTTSSGTNRNFRFYNSSPIDNLPILSAYPTSGTDVGMSMTVIPKGAGFAAGQKAQISIFNTDFIADATNYEALVMRSSGTRYLISSFKAGTGTIRPIVFSAGAAGSGTPNDNQLVLNIDGTVSMLSNLFIPSIFASTDVTFPVSTGTNRTLKLQPLSVADNFGGAAFYPTSGTNVGSTLTIFPKGTGLNSTTKTQLSLYNTDGIADATNYEAGILRAAGTDGVMLGSVKGGTGTLRSVSIDATGSFTSSTANMVFKTNGGISVPATNTTTGTTGAQTINKTSGKVNFAAAAITLVVTNSLVSTTSIVIAQVEGSDATAISARTTPASGSFTITLNAAATAETKVSFLVIN